jgi:N-acetylmuramoyl-L-alanine amidase
MAASLARRGVWLVLAATALLLVACGGSAPAAVSQPQPGDVSAASALEVPAVAPLAPEPQAPARKVNAKKVVALDPGHGGEEVGSARNGVVEKQSNLDMALRVERLLLEAGYDVVLTRREDRRVAYGPAGFTPTYWDLQARADVANAANADVFVSLHSNGHDDGSQRGVESWYDSKRADGTQNRDLARLLNAHVLEELRRYGYSTTDRGLYDGSCFRQRNGRCFTLFIIGGLRETTRQQVIDRGGDPEALGFNGAPSVWSRPTLMPSALAELLFVTNESDNRVLRDEAGRQAMARGVAAAIQAFLGPPQ